MAAFKIRNDVGATVFSILSGLSVLFLTAWMFSPGGCAGPKESVAISPLPANEEEVASLKQQLADAKAEIIEESERRSELAFRLRDRDAQIADLVASKNEVDARVTALGAELEEFKTASAAREEALKQKLAASGSAKIEGLQDEVSALKEQLANERKACNQAKAKLNAEIEKLQTGLDQALYGDQLKPAGDFPALNLPFLVNNPIQLNRKVRPVFIELRGMKDDNAELAKVYEGLTKDGKTSALHKVPFTVGSAEVTDAEQKKLADLLEGSPKNARYLVVGYASTDGDAKSNHELSSKRASSVAAKLASIEGVSKDSVQAVYFGQTKRFSASDMAPNRIVEVWRVK